MLDQKLKKNVLIVGAGPVGLAAALFMTSNPAVNISIIEKLKQRKNIMESKALLVNPRTMAIFQGYKTQKRIQELAIKNMKITIATPNWEILNIPLFEKFKQRHPQSKGSKGFFIYPQHMTERLIQEELLEKGVKVQRGVQLESLRNEQNSVKVKLSNQNTEKSFDVVLGADGARSKVRKELGIKFIGQEVKTLLRVTDYQVKGQPWREGRLLIGNPKFVMYLPVRENLIRIVSNFVDEKDFLQNNAGRKLQLGQKVWHSEFKLKNMHATSMNVGNVYLAGDSAHIHIPMGGRGMNMGIQDAFIFANLLRQNRLKEYNQLRMPVIQDFIKKVSRSTVIVDEEPSYKKAFLPYLVKLAFLSIKWQMMDFIGGADHNIPFLH